MNYKQTQVKFAKTELKKSNLSGMMNMMDIS